jgi:glycosyltransferase involved in cell wall biosynthesis
MQRVIIVSDFAQFQGGAAKVAMNSAVGLAARGIEVIFFCAVGPVHESLKTSGVVPHCLEQHEIIDDPSRVRAFKNGLWNTSAKDALGELLSKYSPDDTIVHFHQWTKALSPSVFSAKHLSDFPRTVTHHDYFVACPNGGFFQYPKGQICELKPLSMKCITSNCDPRHRAHKVWRMGRQYVQNSLKGGPGTFQNQIFVSKFTRDILQPYVDPKAALHWIGNPINVQKMDRVVAEKNEEFIFLGRFSVEKGGPLFAEAAKRLGVKAVFIGDGERRADIERANSDVEITGWVPSTVVEERLKRARFLIFPSLWYECQPLSVQECASRGIAALVGDRSAARELVTDQKTGLYFKNGDLDDLTEKLSLLRDDDRVRDLSTAAYESFWSGPRDIEFHVDELLAIYDRTVQDHKRASTSNFSQFYSNKVAAQHVE